MNPLKQTFPNVCKWPAAGAQLLDFVAALPTTSMHQLRLLWSRQTEKS